MISHPGKATMVPLLLATFACGGSDAQGAASGIAMRATSSALTSDGAGGSGGQPSSGIQFQDDAGRTYTATEILARVTEIELKLPDGLRCADYRDQLGGGAYCDDPSNDDDGDDDDEIRIDGPFVVDLLAGTSTPSLDDVQIPALPYREIEFDLEDGPRGDALDGHAFSLRATFDDDGTQAELVLRVPGDLEIEIDNPVGANLQPNAQLLVLLDASRWLQGVPLQECIDDSGAQVVNGVLTLDADDACDDLEEAFEEVLEDSCSFDGDDDDDFDDDKDDDKDDDDRNDDD
jgi:hypothetical protein